MASKSPGCAWRRAGCWATPGAFDVMATGGGPTDSHHPLFKREYPRGAAGGLPRSALRGISTSSTLFEGARVPAPEVGVSLETTTEPLGDRGCQIEEEIEGGKLW